MVDNNPYLNKLSQISKIIDEKYSDHPHIGGLVGISGMALFQFYYSKLLGTNEGSDKGAKILSKCIEMINNGYTFPSYCTGLAGAGWVFDHLAEENFIELNNDDLLVNLDNYFNDVMKINMKNGNYDFLHGALGYGFYFLNRYKCTKSVELRIRYRNYLLDLISMLNDLAETDENGIKWISILKSKIGDKGYNFGLSHGISSVVNFLSRLYQYDDFKNEVYSMLTGGVEFLLYHMEKDGSEFSMFPNWLKNGQYNEGGSRVAWCYGDLGVGVTLLQASKSLKNVGLKEVAIKILHHTASRRSFENNKVVDAALCHGSFGNAQIFNRVYKETGDKRFRDAAFFWMNDGMKRATFSNGYAGFKQWSGLKKDWQEDLSLLEGIAGIGLSLISHLSGNNSWDECLMIG